MSATALLLLAPMIAVVALVVRRRLGSPVFFRQVRPGRNAILFELVKFRTMTDQRGARGELLPDEQRLKPFGKWLRSTSLDELPELWNVLRGDMSLVGPRPALPHETEEWDALLAQRLRVKPGITGMWQVSGRSDTSFEDYTRLDLYYVDNWSLATDVAILAKTVPVVLLRQGAK